MKKIFVLVMVIVIMMSLTIVAFAEGESFGMVNNVLDRVFEWWEANKAEILAACSGLGTLVASAYLWCKSKKPLGSLISSAETTSKNETALIKGYNEMVAVVEKQNVTIEKQNVTIENLSQTVIMLKEQITNIEKIEAHTARVLSTVYVNNDALPQGIKRIVGLECAEALTIASKDLGVSEVTYDEEDEGCVD